MENNGESNISSKLTLNKVYFDARSTKQNRLPGITERISRTKNAYLEPDICDQGLAFILRTIWIFLAGIIFVIWKYSLQ